MALSNTGPLDDPLVRGIDLGGQFGIGQDPSAADRSRSRARPNVSQSRDSLLHCRRRSKGVAVAIERLIDLGQEIVTDHLIANVDRVSKAFGVGSTMTLDHDSVKSEEHAAIGFVGIQLFLERLERAPGKQIAEP